jgi:hypothetical protein
VPLDPAKLDSLALAYAEGMTSIRGRRVQSLLRPELAGFDSVRRVKGADGGAALLARKRDGTLAFCQTTGRGPAADIVVSESADGCTVTTSYDLLKDSLPALQTSRSKQDRLAHSRRS